LLNIHYVEINVEFYEIHFLGLYIFHTRVCAREYPKVSGLSQ